MTLTPTNADLLDAGNGTESLVVSLGSLGLREDVLQGFMTIRSQHHQLEGLLHQMMRKVVLPRCREIGAELDRIRSLYPKGKKGPGGQASGFFRDAEICTGLKKRQVLNYISLSTGWHKLIEHMADLPEGAEPIQSMRSALAALQAMNRPERPALPGTDGAVDVDAEQVQGSDLPVKRTRYAHSTREKVLPALVALKGTPVGQKHQERLDALYQGLIDLLDEMEQEEQSGAAAADEWADPASPALAPLEPIALPQPVAYAHPQAAPAPVPPAPAAVEPPAPVAATSLEAKGRMLAEFFNGEVITDEETESAPAAAATASTNGRKPKALSTLPGLYPCTLEGMEAIDLAIVEHGGAPGLARSLGLSTAAVQKHRSRSRAKLGLT